MKSNLNIYKAPLAAEMLVYLGDHQNRQEQWKVLLRTSCEVDFLQWVAESNEVHQLDNLTKHLIFLYIRQMPFNKRNK